MRQRGDRPRLLLEPPNRIGILREIFGDHLDRHLAMQARVAGAIHHAHPAGAKRRDNLVGPEPRACGEHHAS